MRIGLGVSLGAGLLLCAAAVFGQAAPAPLAAHAPEASGPSFDVASIRLAADLSGPAAQAAMMSGKMPKFGQSIEGLRAEYNQMALRDLVALAYGVKPYQVTGPDALNGQRFDIAAKMPEGSTASDAPGMLRALLVERFKLEATSKIEDHPVLALIVGKTGPKMTAVPAPPPIDFTAELQPGQRKMDFGDGPVIVSNDMTQGSFKSTMDEGSKGKMTYSMKMGGQTFSMHLEFKGITMPALAVMLTQMMTGGPGSGVSPKPVVDMTGLTGNYDTSMDFTPQITMMGGGGGGNGLASASDPGGGMGATIYDSVQKMGLKLDPRKAPVQQVVVTHVEKTPTEN